MKNIFFIPCILLISLINLKAFSQDGICYVQSSTTTAQNTYSALGIVPPLSSFCTANSSIYHSFFKKKESFIPDNGVTYARSVPKKIKMRFVIINPNPDSTLKLNFTNVDTPFLKSIVDSLNFHSANLSAPIKPGGNCGSCHVYDERIRYELTDIDFITHYESYNLNNDGFTNYGKYKDSILNVYFVCNFDHIDSTTINGNHQFGRGAWADILPNFPTAARSVSRNYIAMSNT